jgi:hypothetical protein
MASTLRWCTRDHRESRGRYRWTSADEVAAVFRCHRDASDACYLENTDRCRMARRWAAETALRRRGADAEAGRGTAVAMWRTLEHVWPDGDDDLVECVPGRIRHHDLARSSHCKHTVLRPGPAGEPMPKRSAGGVVYRWRWRSCRLPEPAGVDCRTIYSRPVFKATWGQALPYRRLGALFEGRPG